ncbi:hypothetical protein [Sediminibacterium ginsengisoli]|uniref:Uncharacterized protein n=1 Tax=Sediminibacterium ginsengisoli TaxID=413434 RepID=A0A1T4NHI8_9BACT|nr:hypothetical protein [Sediminibacterium ginsengisoli]SJZ78228.1 hypothetical protein SAMN04488132_104242 [Sediminibacterium ginsengisoli]
MKQPRYTVKMGAFMDGLYGAVIAVGLINYVKDIATQDTPVDLADAFRWSSLFHLLFTLITITIVSHDWLAYKRADAEEERRLIHHFPNILALFFIAQMFNSTTFELLPFWYFFGTWYVLCSVVNSIFSKAQRHVYLRYVIYLLICGIAIWLFYFEKCSLAWAYGFLIVSTAIIFYTWDITDKERTKKNPAA